MNSPTTTNLGYIYCNQWFWKRSKFIWLDNICQWAILYIPMTQQKNMKQNLLTPLNTLQMMLWLNHLMLWRVEPTYSRTMCRWLFVLEDPRYFTMFLWFRFCKIIIISETHIINITEGNKLFMITASPNIER